MIIFDCASHCQGDGLVCQPLKEYSLYDRTPKLVISTFKVDCDSCSEFQAGMCAHIQKPFKVSEVASAVKEMVLFS